MICLDPDRLSRNLGHLLLLEEETKKYDVQLLFVYFPREDSPEGKLMLSVRGAVAEYERAEILQRSRTGREARARKGLPMTHHCLPYGYRYDKNRMLEPEPLEAEIVNRIFALRLSGIGIMKIVRLLSVEGIPTRSDIGLSISPKTRGRGVWAPSTIHRMLRSTTYVGRMAWNKRHYEEMEESRRRKPRRDKRPQTREVWNPREQWIEIPCPAIVDQQTWNAVQTLLDHGKTYANAGRKYEYLFLNGRVRCGRCGYALSGFYESKRQARFYRCSANKHHASMKCWRTVRADTLEEQVWDVIHNNLLGEPEFLALELERRRAGANQQSRVTSNDVELINGKIASLDCQLQRWKDAYASEAINLDEFTEIKKPLDAEISALSRLRDELAGKLSAIHHRQEEIDAAVLFIRRVSDELPTYSITERRKVVEVLDVRVIYHDAGDVQLHFMIPAESDIDPREIWESPLFTLAPGTE